MAERAGVSIGSLYQYFPGKDAITAALIRRETATLLDLLDAAVPAATGKSLEEGVALLAEAAVAHQFARPRLSRLLDVEEARLPWSAEASATRRAILNRVVGFLRGQRPSLDEPALTLIGGDLLHIARGLIDGAAEDSTDRLSLRVNAALTGYLRQAAPI